MWVKVYERNWVHHHLLHPCIYIKQPRAQNDVRNCLNLASAHKPNNIATKKYLYTFFLRESNLRNLYTPSPLHLKTRKLILWILPFCLTLFPDISFFNSSYTKHISNVNFFSSFHSNPLISKCQPDFCI